MERLTAMTIPVLGRLERHSNCTILLNSPPVAACVFAADSFPIGGEAEFGPGGAVLFRRGRPGRHAPRWDLKNFRGYAAMLRTSVICGFAAVLATVAGHTEPPPQAATLELTLERAIELALAPNGNIGVQLADQSIEQAENVHRQAQAVRRPVIESYVSERNIALNLEAIGVQFEGGDESMPLMLPRRVGPFNTLDVRVAARYNLVDPGGKRHEEAAEGGISVARAGSQEARNGTAFAVARLYNETLRHNERLATLEANLEFAQALLAFAERQRDAGTGDAIEITRARSQLADEEYHLAAARSDQEIGLLKLLHVMGQPLDTDLRLVDSLSADPAPIASAEEAAAHAKSERADLQTSMQRIEKARLDDRAIHSERLPTLAVFADVGAQNTGANPLVETHTVGVSLRFPVFDGGRRSSRRAEAASRIRREELEGKRIHDQIDLQARESTRRLRLREHQIRVAGEGLALAEEELARARRRYENGVTNSLEVIEAQTRLKRAQDNRLEAMYEYNRAKIDFVEVQGDVGLLMRP